MEHKQTLWIISAVGVFLLVVIGAALIFYSPSATVTAGSTQAVTYTPPSSSVTPAGTMPTTPGFTTPAPTGTPALVGADGKAIPIDENQLKTILQALAAANTADPPPPAEPVPTVTALTSKARETIAKPVAPAAIPAAVKSAPVPVSSQYWIQAAAFTSKNNADNARVALENAKIPGEVFTHTDSQGRVVYRVRVGPYTSKTEAEYWQTQIGNIKNFAGTQTFVVKS